MEPAEICRVLSGKTVAFHTLGCKVNAYESEAMEELLRVAGLRVISFREKADIYVINTCSVTNTADKKSRQMLHRARAKNPEALIVASGCYTQIQCDKVADGPSEETLLETGADLIIGNNEKDRVAELIAEKIMDRETHHPVAPIAKETGFMDLSLTSLSENTRAYLKVQDGCNQFCSYCIIPYARGRIRSKDPASALAEARELALKGVKELVITGIHLSSYGIPSGERYDDLIKKVNVQEKLLELIEAIHGLEGVERIRLGSLEPRIVTEEFCRRLSALTKLCPHFHLSLQSGSEQTLRRMNRHYTKDEFREGCRLLRQYFDYPAITTDVITGFPGETEEDFLESLRFVEEIGFYELHVFPYSRRKGTVADRLPGQVNETVKAERSARMIALGERMSAEYRRNLLGRTVEILYETPDETPVGRRITGYSKEYVRFLLPEGAETNRVYRGIAGDSVTENSDLLQVNIL